jgi:lipopolysaccharide assembly LptE-like protein
MSAARKAFGPCWPAGLCLALAACGYSTGLTIPQAPEPMLQVPAPSVAQGAAEPAVPVGPLRTVGVEFFANDSPVRDLERDLQAALSRSVERLVRAPLISPKHSDVVLRGRILDYARRSGIRSPQNQLLETGVRIVVEGELARRPAPGQDPADPSLILRRTRFGTESGYRLLETQGEADARTRVLENLADRLVLDLFAPLDYEASAPRTR